MQAGARNLGREQSAKLTCAAVGDARARRRHPAGAPLQQQIIPPYSALLTPLSTQSLHTSPLQPPTRAAVGNARARRRRPAGALLQQQRARRVRGVGVAARGILDGAKVVGARHLCVL